jgi:hypothetical protein
MVVRTPTMASLARTYLSAELEHRCVGEDDRITIERQREMIHNYKCRSCGAC